MEIFLFPLTRLNQWQLFQMMEEVITFSQQHTDNMPLSFDEKLASLQAAFDVYDEVIAQETRISATHQLEIDEERNYALSKMYQVISTYADYKYAPEKELAARALQKTLKPYGSGRSIGRMNQQAKTAVTTNMLQDLAKEAALSHLTALRLSELILALTQTNKEFINEQNLRLSVQAKFVTGVAKSARAEVQKQFLEFTALINALAVVEGDQKYAALKKTISATVNNHVAQARQRIGKKEEPLQE
ncbi:MAG: DUF6261 family protein [Candidatus Saccharimonadaceae bacterium]